VKISAGRLADLARGRHTDDARDLEDQAVRDAIGRADQRLADALADAAGMWARTFGDLDHQGTGTALSDLLTTIRERVTASLSGLGRRSRRILLETLPRALTLGTQQAYESVTTATGRTARAAGRAAGRVSDAAKDAAHALPGAVAEQLDKALRLLAPNVVEGRRFPAVAAGIAAARTALARVRSAIAWAIHHTVNTGIDAAAGKLRLRRVWVAEHNACLRCQAYSGRTATVRGDFTPGPAFDPRQGEAAAVHSPPLHPHCRCRTVLWSEAWPVRGESLPALLTRQAREAVGRGWSLPSESTAARLRAARRLLDDGEQLPPSVAAAARRALREHRFPYRARTAS
jgi:hypothetical protein